MVEQEGLGDAGATTVLTSHVGESFQIGFSYPRHFLGRNGWYQCKALYVYVGGDMIELQPITSKGSLGRCSIEIPTENIGGLIEVLQKIQTYVK